MNEQRLALKTAISHGDADQVLQFFGPATRHTKQVRRDLLNYALGLSCKYCQPECVKIALDLKAQPDIKCEDLEFLPLFYAAQLPVVQAEQASEIIRLLVDSKADLDVRDQDHNGSNALMWAKTKEAARSLLTHSQETASERRNEADRYMDSKDNDGKTALIWSVITHTDVSVSHFLIEQGSDRSGTDDQGSTPLHWAARENNRPFAQALLEKYNDMKVNVVNHGGRTPIHLAIGKNCGDMVDLLLEYDARDVTRGDESALNMDSAGGWLPLHVLCGVQNVHPHIAWQVISRTQAKHLVRPTNTGKTPLIIAADNGNIAVIEQLQIRFEAMQLELDDERKMILEDMEQLKIDVDANAVRSKRVLTEKLDLNLDMNTMLLSARGMRDNAGNIALFNAGMCDSFAVREFLAPWNLKDSPRDVKPNDPTKCFQAKIVDLLTNPKKIDVGSTSIFDLIYTNPELSHSAARRTLPRKPCKYRWIHLPANKRSWCRDLFAKYFIELWHAGRIDESGQNGVQNGMIDDDVDQKTGEQTSKQPASVGNKASFNTISANYHTIEHFQMLARTLVMQRIGRTTHSAYMTPRCRAILPAHINSIGIRRPSEPTFLDGDSKDDNEDSQSEDSLTNPYGLRKSSNDLSSTGHAAKGATISSPSLFLYMPYLNFEYFHDLNHMKAALNYDPTKDDPAQHGFRSAYKGPYSKSLFTGIHGEERDYHPRRTLDQFFYRNITTDERDNDQVVFRYQSDDEPKGLDIPASQCKVIMVDELWMWIVSEEFIVTSFPERWNQKTKAQFDIWESVINHITIRGTEEVSTVYDLAALISDTCSKAFDICDTGMPRFMDMFEASLGDAMEGAMSASRKLNQASAQGSKWLRSVSEEDDVIEQETRAATSTSSNSRNPSKLSSTTTRYEQDEDGMEFVDSLLDLRNETGLVYQISDTRDEMEILSMVLTWQRRILKDLSSVLEASSPAGSGDSHLGCQRAVNFIHSSLRMVNMTTSELKRMDKQAKRIYATVTNILDIKQKYANAIEARSVRAGGLTIMVFTVATVFFLPASFIISFFGLNLSSLPHHRGNVVLSTSLVCRWVLGLGVGIALIYLAVAFRFRSILRWLGINKMRRSLARTYRAFKRANLERGNESTAAVSSFTVSRSSTSRSFALSHRSVSSNLNGKEDV